MIRFGIIISLILSFFLLIKGNLQTWQANKPSREDQDRPRKARVITGMRQIRFYPDVPLVVPDMTVGYLFNEKRSLLDAPPDDEFDEEVLEEEEAVIDIEMVTYIGSIITDSLRQAMVTYVPAPDPVEPQMGSMMGGAPQRQAGRFPVNRPQMMSPVPMGVSTPKNAMVLEGEEFHGYVVASVLPDKIIFTRGEDKHERLLFDPGKDRGAPPPRVERRMPTPSGSGQAPGMPGFQPQAGGQMNRRLAPMSRGGGQQGFTPPPPVPSPPSPEMVPSGVVPTRRHGVQPEVIQRRRIPPSMDNR